MLKKVLNVLLVITEHAPTILTVFIGAYVVLKNQEKAYEVTKLLEWIITILALIATSMLIERFIRLSKIEKAVEEINTSLKNKSDKASLDGILLNRKQLEPLEERLQFSKNIQIVGASLFRLTTEYMGFFEEKALEGCKFQFLLLNPDCELTKLTATYVVYEIANVETYISNVQTAIENLKKFKTKFSDYVEIKIIDYIPAYSMIITDSEKDIGTIRIEFYPFSVPTRERPHIVLQKSREPVWYKFFQKQFESMWHSNGAKIIE